jgi:hypothetical protein
MNNEQKVRRVRVQVNPGHKGNPEPNVGVIAILFKEVLRELPEDAARELADAYRQGARSCSNFGKAAEACTSRRNFSSGSSRARRSLASSWTGLRRNIDAENNGGDNHGSTEG